MTDVSICDGRYGGKCDNGAGAGAGTKEGRGSARAATLADLDHLPMAAVVEACLEMEIWLSRQVTFESDAARAAELRRALDPELTKLMDEQLHLVQKELLLRAVDIFDYPEEYVHFLLSPPHLLFSVNEVRRPGKAREKRQDDGENIHAKVTGR